MLTVLGGLAEFERELIRARTGDAAGLCSALFGRIHQRTHPKPREGRSTSSFKQCNVMLAAEFDCLAGEGDRKTDVVSLALHGRRDSCPTSLPHDRGPQHRSRSAVCARTLGFGAFAST
jgi:hypothetical protein